MLPLVHKSLWIITMDVCPAYMRIECVYSTLPHDHALLRLSRDKRVDREFGNSIPGESGSQTDVSTHKQVLTSKALVATKQSLITNIYYIRILLPCRLAEQPSRIVQSD